MIIMIVVTNNVILVINIGACVAAGREASDAGPEAVEGAARGAG